MKKRKRQRKNKQRTKKTQRRYARKSDSMRMTRKAADLAGAYVVIKSATGLIK